MLSESILCAQCTNSFEFSTNAAANVCLLGCWCVAAVSGRANMVLMVLCVFVLICGRGGLGYYNKRGALNSKAKH